MKAWFIDAGNSRIKFGCVIRGRPKACHAVLTERWRAGGPRPVPRGWDDLGGAPVWIASVVPDVNDTLERELRRRGAGDVRFVDHRSGWSFRFDYPKPATLGADRLANAEGAMGVARPPLIVVSIGTAATLDVVTGDGRFAGGLIAPGPALWVDALADRTAKLPRLKASPDTPGRIGKSTEQAMRLAAAWGFPAMIEGLLNRLKQLDPDARWSVVATGGGLDWMPAIPGVKRAPNLALAGLARLAGRNER